MKSKDKEEELKGIYILFFFFIFIPKIAKMELYKLRLKETKKSYKSLHNTYIHTNEILQEHIDTIKGYTEKVISY